MPAKMSDNRGTIGKLMRQRITYEIRRNFLFFYLKLFRKK